MHLKHFYSLRLRLTPLFVLLLTLLAGHGAQATHIRAGDIVASQLGSPLQYRFNLVIYVDPMGAPQLEATLFFGDGTSQTVQRELPVVIVPNVINKNEFIFTHTYNAPGYYAVSFTGENRNTGIVNMNNSVQTSVYLQTDVFINPLIGFNQTPRMTVSPIDKAVRGQLFEHSPGAYDPEGDSLSFKLVVPRMSLTCETCPPSPAPVVNYTSPVDPVHQPTSSTGGQPFFNIDPVTGLISWDAPGRLGEYNIAFIVEEWRLVQRGQPRLKMSVTTRDMQIIVVDDPNRPPKLEIPKDLCVLPGTVIRDTIRVTDPDGHGLERLELFSPLLVTLIPASPPVPVPGSRIDFIQLDSATYEFIWDMTECTDVRSQPYQFVFKATDIPGGSLTPLVDFATWSIKVVGPPPTNVVAVPDGQNINLTWDPYSCPNAERIKIYRRENPYPFIPDSCELGVPAYTGYVRIADVPVTATSFTDNNNGQGLGICINYSYILSVDFPLPGAGESYASNEAFTELDLLAPVLTKVSVQTTDPANGQIQVNWQPPQTYDPVSPSVSYRISVMRAEGPTPGAFTEIYNTVNFLTDTTFLDTGLNTSEQTYHYRIDWYKAEAGGPFMLDQSSEAGSSVFLSGVSGTLSIGLTWAYNTPWDNSNNQHYIYREISGVFTLIDSVLATGTSGQYTDLGTYQNMPLQEKKTYCYYVTTQGDYRCDTLPQNILNNSQQICVFLEDLTAPCTPILTLEPIDCDNFTLDPPYTNRLKWRFDLAPGCDTTDVAYYTVYYTGSTAAPLDSITFTSEQFFNHGNLVSLAGCYAVTATDSAGNQTPRSNVVCQDNCFFFELPNIITPNGDNVNDFFRPSPRTRFVKSFSVSIFNRWGTRIYDNNKPDTFWGGKDSSGRRVPAGVYFYQAEVEFFTLNPADSKKIFKGWVEVVF